jgi:hypothetical protein
LAIGLCGGENNNKAKMWARSAGFKLTQARFPGAAQHGAERNDALLTRDRDKTQSPERSRISGAPLRAAPRPGNIDPGNLPRCGNVSSIMRAVRARNTTF